MQGVIEALKQLPEKTPEFPLTIAVEELPFFPAAPAATRPAAGPAPATAATATAATTAYVENERMLRKVDNIHSMAPL